MLELTLNARFAHEALTQVRTLRVVGHVEALHGHVTQHERIAADHHLAHGAFADAL
jgi:hypothetical protein